MLRCAFFRSLGVCFAADDLVSGFAVHERGPGEGLAARGADARGLGVIHGDALEITLHEAALAPLAILIQERVARADT